MIYQRDKKPTLPWRRSKGRECGNCPWVLATVPEASANRGAFLVKLEAQPAAREKYLQTVRDWEDEKNRTSGSHFRQQPAAEGTVEATS